MIERNPAQGLGLKDTQQDIEKRFPLSDDDIKRIFFCADYKPGTFKNPACYWVPLIASIRGCGLKKYARFTARISMKKMAIFD